MKDATIKIYGHHGPSKLASVIFNILQVETDRELWNTIQLWLSYNFSKEVRVSLKFVAQRSDNNISDAPTESLLFPDIQITLRNERTDNNKHFAEN
jgi:hypothetical protein